MIICTSMISLHSGMLSYYGMVRNGILFCLREEWAWKHIFFPSSPESIPGVKLACKNFQDPLPWDKGKSELTTRGQFIKAVQQETKMVHVPPFSQTRKEMQSISSKMQNTYQCGGTVIYRYGCLPHTSSNLSAFIPASNASWHVCLPKADTTYWANGTSLYLLMSMLFGNSSFQASLQVGDYGTS